MNADFDVDYTKLKEARLEIGISQAEVERRCGLERGHLWQYENGKALPLKPFLKLVMFYKKPLEYYLAEVAAQTV